MKGHDVDKIVELLNIDSWAKFIVYAAATSWFTILGVAAFWAKSAITSKGSYDSIQKERRRHKRTSEVGPGHRMGPFDMTTCTPQNWQSGEKMRHLRFQWSPDCDHVDQRGSFEFYNKDGKRVNYYDKEVAYAQ